MNTLSQLGATTSFLGEPKPREFLVEDLLPKCYPATIYGTGGVAKSMLALLMGISYAGGLDRWLGLRVNGKGAVRRYHQVRECGRNMMIHSVLAARAKGRRFYYRCRTRNRDGAEACSHRKCHRADEVEPRVWDLISGLLKDPERLKAGLEEMIEQERAGLRGDPDKEVKSWHAKLSEVDQERRGYLRLAAKGRLTDEELDEALAELEDTRETAEKELRAISTRREVLENLERDRDALLGSYASMTPAALDALSPEERHQVYKMLRLTVEISPDGSLAVSGVLGNSFVSENQDEGVVFTHYQVDLPRRVL